MFFFGMVVNVSILAYFKFKGATFGYSTNKGIELPLGISFYTITLMVYLLYVYRTNNKGNLLNVSLVAAYFPHLAAGPILYYKNISEQLKSLYYSNDLLFKGITIFLIGLTKKLVIADSIAPYADYSYEFAASGTISMLYAWLGAASYLLQLYFDFSGYSDMAIGLSLMFGVKLPINFNSPLKARSFIDFWNNWHMSLYMVLKDFIFKPVRKFVKTSWGAYVALFSTMLVGGVWHGATLNFLIFGSLSGVILSTNYWYRRLIRKTNFKSNKFSRLIAQLVTLLTLIVLCVLFRSESLATSITMYKGMLGLNGIINSVPGSEILNDSIFIPETLKLTLQGMSLTEWSFLLFSFFITSQVFQNSNQLVGIDKYESTSSWSVNFKWGLFAGFLFFLSFGFMSESGSFLYVNF